MNQLVLFANTHLCSFLLQLTKPQLAQILSPRVHPETKLGFFVRVLLPVALTDGFAVEFGTWLEVDAEDFRLAWQTWNFPEYTDLVLEGYIGNQIAPWNRFRHSLVKAVVRDQARVPVITSGANEEIDEILGKTWPHAEVLASYRDLLRADVPPPAQEG